VTTFVVTVICLVGVDFAILVVIILGARRSDDAAACLARGVCPLHPDKPANGSECGCTWLLSHPEKELQR